LRFNPPEGARHKTHFLLKPWGFYESWGGGYAMPGELTARAVKLSRAPLSYHI